MQYCIDFEFLLDQQTTLFFFDVFPERMSFLAVDTYFGKYIKFSISFVPRYEAFDFFTGARLLWHELVTWKGQNF